MADEVVVQAPKATVYVERSIQVRQYESLKVGIHFPVELPMPIENADSAAWLAATNEAIKGAFFTAKAHVYEQAGVHFEDKDGVLVEMVTAKFEGAAEVVAQPPRQAPAAPATEGDPKCPDCDGPIYDNRPKKATGEYNPKAPDLRCQDKACGWVKWPPRGKGGR
jgi:hypothetical protein